MMKNPLQFLLIFFALSLCALCTRQWHVEVFERKEITRLSQFVYDQAVSIQGYTNSINNMDHKIAQMDATMGELNDTIKTNSVVIFGLHQENNTLTLQLEQYSNAVALVQDQIRTANESIKRQNEVLKDVAAQRDEYVTKLNESVKERNGVVVKYNELVKQFEEYQEKMQPKKDKEKKKE